MKKSLLFLALISFAVSGYSQFEIRPFIGANFSNVSKAPDGISTKAKIGSQVGVGVMFGHQFYFNPQISYFWRSTEFSFAGDNNGSNSIKADQKISGVSIPLLVGFKFVDAANDPFFNVRVFGGPSMLFMTNQEFTNKEVDKTVDWKTTQWSAQLGVGLDVSIFFVDAAYEFGLTKTNKPIDGSNIKDLKNNTFYINAGVRLKFAN